MAIPEVIRPTRKVLLPSIWKMAPNTLDIPTMPISLEAGHIPEVELRITPEVMTPIPEHHSRGQDQCTLRMETLSQKKSPMHLGERCPRWRRLPIPDQCHNIPNLARSRKVMGAGTKVLLVDDREVEMSRVEDSTAPVENSPMNHRALVETVSIGMTQVKVNITDNATYSLGEVFCDILSKLTMSLVG